MNRSHHKANKQTHTRWSHKTVHEHYSTVYTCDIRWINAHLTQRKHMTKNPPSFILCQLTPQKMSKLIHVMGIHSLTWRRNVIARFMFRRRYRQRLRTNEHTSTHTGTRRANMTSHPHLSLSLGSPSTRWASLHDETTLATLKNKQTKDKHGSHKSQHKHMHA